MNLGAALLRIARRLTGADRRRHRRLVRLVEASTRRPLRIPSQRTAESATPDYDRARRP